MFNPCNIEALFLKVNKNRRPEIQIQSIIVPLLQLSLRAVGRVRFLYLAIDLCYIPLRFYGVVFEEIEGIFGFVSTPVPDTG